MKKQAVIFLIILFVIIIMIFFAVMQNVSAERDLAKYNEQYNCYLNKQIFGTEVASLINKAINENERNGVIKNEDNYYIANETNSIKIYVKLEQDGENFVMEKIFNVGITEFVRLFNLIDFTCTKVNYHKQTGKVSEIYFEIIN